MNKRLSHICIIFLLFILLGSSITHGWNGLIATTGDILSTAKWNELVNKVLPIYSTGGVSGNVGIGISNPGNKLEISHGTAGNSGLRFRDLTAASANGTVNGKNLSVNANGDVIMVPELRQRVILAADVTKNNTTFSDVTGLSWSVVSGTQYQFECRVRYTSSVATTGSRWSLNGPTFSVLAYTSSYGNTTTARSFFNGTAYNIGTASANTTALAGSIALIEGFITPSANGTVSVSFASENTGVITAKAGSTCEYWTY